jgi:hypothetical protein
MLMWRSSEFERAISGIPLAALGTSVQGVVKNLEEAEGCSRSND